MALCALLRQVLPKEQLVALFVDHNLQSRGVTESTEFVEQALQKLDVEGKFMRINWTESELAKLTKGQIQETLRDRRQALLIEAGAAANARLVVTGHNLDDDIITMFYRMSHASGLDGLSGMRLLGTFPITHRLGGRVFLGHPLLGISKARLQATCEELGLTWNRDESNQDYEYLRNSTTAVLATMQEQGIVGFDELQQVLTFFKTFRKDMHDAMTPVFDEAVAVDRRNGDALFVLNNGRVVQNRPVLTRVISTLAQYAGVRFGQIRTSRLLEMHGKILGAYERYQADQAQLRAILAKRFRTTPNLFPIDQARRLETGQLIVNNATFYPLSRSDSYRRVQSIHQSQGREIKFGPAFLVQRQPPSGLSHQASGFASVKVVLAPGEPVCWDGRFELSYGLATATPREAPPTFAISYATPADARDFEKLVPRRSPMQRKLFAHMSITPGSHLYQIPVIRELDGLYMAFPTLDCVSDGRYTWTCKPLGLHYLMSRFQCAP